MIDKLRFMTVLGPLPKRPFNPNYDAAEVVCRSVVLYSIFLASVMFFFVNVPYFFVISLVIAVLFSLFRSNPDFSMAILASLIVSFSLFVFLMHVIQKHNDSFYEAFLVFFVVYFFCSCAPHFFGAVEKFALDAFLLTIFALSMVEFFIVSGGLFLDFQPFENWLKNIPELRLDVLRATALYGTPLLLAPIMVTYLARELLIYGRPLFFMLILFLIFMTGSRSALLASVFLLLLNLNVFLSLKMKGYLICGAIASGWMYFFSNVSFFYKNVDRALTAFTDVLLLRDPSVIGRLGTSGRVVENIFSDFSAILYGAKHQGTSDAALASIGQQNGLVFLIIFAAIFLFVCARLLPIKEMFAVVTVTLFISISVGGALSVGPLAVMAAFLREFQGARYSHWIKCSRRQLVQPPRRGMAAFLTDSRHSVR